MNISAKDLIFLVGGHGSNWLAAAFSRVLGSNYANPAHDISADEATKIVSMLDDDLRNELPGPHKPSIFTAATTEDAFLDAASELDAAYSDAVKIFITLGVDYDSDDYLP